MSAMLLKLKVRKKRKNKHFLKSVSKVPPKKYIDNLHHCDMFDLADFLKTCAQIDNKIRQITRTKGRKEVMKYQIRIFWNMLE